MCLCAKYLKKKLRADFDNFLEGCISVPEGIIDSVLMAIQIQGYGPGIIKGYFIYYTKPSMMVALRCFTDAEHLWRHAKISLPCQQGSVRVVVK